MPFPSESDTKNQNPFVRGWMEEKDGLGSVIGEEKDVGWDEGVLTFIVSGRCGRSESKLPILIPAER